MEKLDTNGPGRGEESPHDRSGPETLETSGTVSASAGDSPVRDGGRLDGTSSDDGFVHAEDQTAYAALPALFREGDIEVWQPPSPTAWRKSAMSHASAAILGAAVTLGAIAATTGLRSNSDQSSTSGGRTLVSNAPPGETPGGVPGMTPGMPGGNQTLPPSVPGQPSGTGAIPGSPGSPAAVSPVAPGVAGQPGGAAGPGVPGPAGGAGQPAAGGPGIPPGARIVEPGPSGRPGSMNPAFAHPGLAPTPPGGPLQFRRGAHGEIAPIRPMGAFLAPPPHMKLPPLTVPPATGVPGFAPMPPGMVGKGGMRPPILAPGATSPSKSHAYKGPTAPALRTGPNGKPIAAPPAAGSPGQSSSPDQEIAVLQHQTTKNPRDAMTYLQLERLYRKKLIQTDRVDEMEHYRSLADDARDKARTILSGDTGSKAPSPPASGSATGGDAAPPKTTAKPPAASAPKPDNPPAGATTGTTTGPEPGG